MSLKAFHIVFVIASTLLSLGLGIYFSMQYNATSSTAHLLLAMACFIGLITLIGYGFWFMKKLKGVGYL